ncbi:MAG: DUF1573 domain-containing protein [Bacteroidales bacterium]
MKYLLTIISVCLSVSFIPAQTTDSSPQNTEITFEYTTYNFDTLQYAEEAECVFPYTNTGKDPLIISKIVSTCGCTIPHSSRAPLAPGETAHVTVSYNTRRSGKFSKNIQVHSNATNSPVVLTLQGIVKQNKNKFIIE